MNWQLWVFFYGLVMNSVTNKSQDKLTNKLAQQIQQHTKANDSLTQFVYLTFDDGPQKGTVACMEVCKQKSVKATFFMVGLHAQQKSDGKQIVAQIKQSYPQFLLANHSFTHAKEGYRSFYKQHEQTQHDFYKAQVFLSVPFTIIRLPGNNVWITEKITKTNRQTLGVTQLLDSAGYNIIGWDAEWHFKKKTSNPVQSAEEMAWEIKKMLAKNKTRTPKHCMVLTHDRMFKEPAFADSLARMIDILKTNEHIVFETCDNYPGLKPLK
jgi:peptidoglycan/xylan/chitin deacetylase (PgdA/CDA1 family)